jgi:DNA-binding MarR family transcriptional regulator
MLARLGRESRVMGRNNASLEGIGLGAWRGLMRAHAAVCSGLEAELEAGHALPLRSFTVLLELDSAPARRMRMSELASAVGLSRSGLSRLIDRLCREGLIERADCPFDARGAFAVLTEAGAQRLQEARADHAAAVRRHFLDHFTADELRELSAYLARVPPGSPGAPIGRG